MGERKFGEENPEISWDPHSFSDECPWETMKILPAPFSTLTRNIRALRFQRLWFKEGGNPKSGFAQFYRQARHLPDATFTEGETFNAGELPVGTILRFQYDSSKSDGSSEALLAWGIVCGYAAGMKVVLTAEASNVSKDGLMKRANILEPADTELGSVKHTRLKRKSIFGTKNIEHMERYNWVQTFNQPPRKK